MMSHDEQLAKAVECPVCLEIPRQGPINQCTNGHLICNACYPKLTTCPVCKCVLAASATRCLLADLVLEFVPNTCKFHTHGCDKVLISKARKEHEVICPFREVQCPNLNCHTKVTLPKLLEHTQTEHKFAVIESGTGTGILAVKQEHFEPAAYEMVSWLPRQLNFQGRNFFTCFTRYPVQEMWKAWVYFAGTPEEAEAFQYKLCIQSPAGEISFRAQVNSLDTSRQDVTKNGFVLTFPDATAKLFCRNEQIPYSITIMLSNPRGGNNNINNNNIEISATERETRKRKKSSSEN